MNQDSTQQHDQIKDLIEKVALATKRFITAEITRTEREAVYDKVYAEISQAIATARSERDKEIIELESFVKGLRTEPFAGSVNSYESGKYAGKNQIILELLNKIKSLTPTDGTGERE